MRRLALFVAFAFVLAMLLPSVASAANIINNGDFEAGNTGFTSGYQYYSVRQQDGGPWIWPPRGYAVGVSPFDWHGYWPVFGDHTSGTGKMQIVNGALDANIPLWSQTVSVQPNRLYRFSFWLAAIATEAPADLEVRINDVAIGSKSSGIDQGQWHQGAFEWKSGSATTAKIQIVDKTQVHSGNDFCVDDISMDIVTLTPGIDVKPGSDVNPVRPDGNGVIPVAILGSADFDASSVDPLSVTFEGLSVRVKGSGQPQASLQDVNGDGYQDLVLQFEDTGGTFEPGQTEAALSGLTTDGAIVKGTDSVKIVP